MKRLSKRHKISFTDEFWPALGGSELKHEDHVDVYQGHDTKDNSKLYECPKGSNKMRWEKSASKKVAMPEDKWQSQKEVVPIGLGERGWQAYEPYKQSSGSDAMAMYWDQVRDSFFDKGNRWSAVVQELKQMYTEITDENIQELQDQVRYTLNQHKTQVESDFGFFDGPTDLGKRPKGDFPSVQWMPRGVEDMDVDPNKTTASKGNDGQVPKSKAEWKVPLFDHRGVQYFGNEEDAKNYFQKAKKQDKDPSKPTKIADVNELPNDFEAQIAAKYGPEYNTALMHYNDAIKNGHAPDRAFQYAIAEMQKVEIAILPDVLSEVVNTYSTK